MRVTELNQEQRTELKQRYFQMEKDASYYELLNIDKYVSDEEINEYYNGVEFYEDDFFTSKQYES